MTAGDQPVVSRWLRLACRADQHQATDKGADPAAADDGAHGPRRAIGKPPDQPGGDDAAAALQGADQGGRGAGLMRESGERARHRIGHDEAEHGDVAEQRHDKPGSPPQPNRASTARAIPASAATNVPMRNSRSVPTRMTRRALSRFAAIMPAMLTPNSSP